MKSNLNHPAFMSFFKNVSNNILSAVKIDDYFSLSKNKKLAVSFTVLNFIKNSAKVKTNLSSSELKGIITILWKKNEEIENYEFAAVLNDIVKNFDIINKLSESEKKSSKQTKKINVTPSL